MAMAEDNKNGGPKPVDSTIEEHAVALSVDGATMAGLKVRQRWARGQRVTKAAFDKALNAFLTGSSDASSAKGAEA